MRVSRSITNWVFPEPLGPVINKRSGLGLSTPLAYFDWAVSQRSYLATWIWSGFLDETMAIAFTGVADTLIAYLERARMQPTQELVDWVGRHLFPASQDLPPRRFRHTDRPGCCTAELESTCCLYHSCHSLVGTVAPSSDAVCLP